MENATTASINLSINFRKQLLQHRHNIRYFQWGCANNMNMLKFTNINV